MRAKDRWPWLIALLLSLGLALWSTGPLALHPGTILIGDWHHPDTLGNHWLLVWVAEQLSGGNLLENTEYYFPFGDSPWLAGNGSEGFLYAPFHALFPWPRSVGLFCLALLTWNAMAGYVLGRAAGGGPWRSLVVCAASGSSVYVAGELGAGRFSQGDLGSFLLGWAALFFLLEAPSRRRALLFGLLWGFTTWLYIYYGLFLALIVLVLLVHRAISKTVIPWRALGVSGFTAGLTISPLAWVYAQRWQEVPGVAEAFPHPMAVQDSIAAVLPFAVDSGIHESQAVALPLLFFAGLGLYRAFRLDRRGLDIGLAMVAVFFFWLALGPEGGLYSGIYGLTPVLERFWWPYRHVLVFCTCIALLACRALPTESRKTPWWALALALATPLSLTLQGDKIKPTLTPVSVPPPVYPELATLPGEVILQPPFTAAAAASQAPLIYQLYHRKKMINGHAPWVDRVRPTAWDQEIEENSFLSALAQLEQGHLATFSFEATDLQSLLDEGLAWVVLDRELFPHTVLGLRQSYRAILEALFGEPRLQESGIRVYDTARWGGVHQLDIPLWTIPEGQVFSQPNRPLEGLRPRSPMFDP